MSQEWSNLAKVVFRRTYTRSDAGRPETHSETVERVIAGNIRGHKVSEEEVATLRYLLSNRKAGPGGRGWWFSGAPPHERLGGAALSNCWFTTAEDWHNFELAQDLLMLGGGVGLSVEHRFVSKLPRVKKGVSIVHRATKDADFIVPDSREGWNELLHRTMKAFFVTGKSFTFSTICVRGYGEKITSFGGTASGPLPLIELIEKISAILSAREGRAVRPIDAADIICAVGEMVVMGNVRRSSIIILGDPWDKEYLKAKRWDLGPIPNQRAKANFSVVADDVDDLHPLFWKTYEHGEPFGIVNRKNIQKYGRMGELKKDTAIGVNPCAEATLEGGPKIAEPCNLQEIALINIEDEVEFELAARMMMRWGKRVTCDKYHVEGIEEVIRRNRRIGIGLTGCLGSALFKPEILDRVYAAVQDEDAKYSAELGVPLSIRTTVIKPGGTKSKCDDMHGYEGLHAAYSSYWIARIRFGANDPQIPALRAAGHHMEPEIRLDGTFDHRTMVVDFYEKALEGFPVADKDWDTWSQLEVLKMAQKHWADQSISVTVYYRREEIPVLKSWLGDNLQYLKTISFLCASDHGFKQAPKEAISKEEYERLTALIKPLETLDGVAVADETLKDAECEGGACPIR